MTEAQKMITKMELDRRLSLMQSQVTGSHGWLVRSRESLAGLRHRDRVSVSRQWLEDLEKLVRTLETKTDDFADHVSLAMADLED